MKQKIDGDNNLQVGSINGGFSHQIAKRDIINLQTESFRPKRLEELFPDELRAEREWSKQLVQDAKDKI